MSLGVRKRGVWTSKTCKCDTSLLANRWKRLTQFGNINQSWDLSYDSIAISNALIQINTLQISTKKQTMHYKKVVFGQLLSFHVLILFYDVLQRYRTRAHLYKVLSAGHRSGSSSQATQMSPCYLATVTYPSFHPPSFSFFLWCCWASMQHCNALQHPTT